MKKSGTKTELRRGRVEVPPKGTATKLEEQEMLLDEVSAGDPQIAQRAADLGKTNAERKTRDPSLSS